MQTNLTGLLQLMAKCTLIFPTDTQQKKIEITNLKPFFSWFENTSVLIILPTTVHAKEEVELTDVVSF